MRHFDFIIDDVCSEQSWMMFDVPPQNSVFTPQQTLQSNFQISMHQSGETTRGSKFKLALETKLTNCCNIVTFYFGQPSTNHATGLPQIDLVIMDWNGRCANEIVHT